jgi:hypothetical protein
MRCNLQKYEIKDPKNRSFSLRTILNMGFNTELLLGDKQSQKPVDYLFSIVEKLPTETPSQKALNTT